MGMVLHITFDRVDDDKTCPRPSLDIYDFLLSSWAFIS